MASRQGPVVQGTDGTDFVHRETVATHYQISVVNKNRLRKCIFVHLLLALVLLTKLMPDILDRVDVFILEVEELEVPQPLTWEYVWLLGSVASFIGLGAIRHNRITQMQVYFGLINLFSTVPLLLAFMIHFSQFWLFCTATAAEADAVIMWQGYPVSGLWYVFLLVALQVHVFTLLFAFRLVATWKGRGKKTV